MATQNIVLVHGNFVDGSGWQGVYDHLTADGYRVAIVQNPTLSLGGDVAATHQVLDSLSGPAVLVGHGLLFLDRDKFAASFADDVPEKSRMVRPRRAARSDRRARSQCPRAAP
jgi:pimeloyl-ACP methyl ester carboxylesterase